MKRLIQGEIRERATALPERLDDFIAEDNPVRVVDAFVDWIDLRELGFTGVEPHATGRPAYHPSVHLKLYKTVKHVKLYAARMVRSNWKSRGIATAPLSPGWSKRARSSSILEVEAGIKLQG